MPQSGCSLRSIEMLVIRRASHGKKKTLLVSLKGETLQAEE